jgi:hypothetical protein
MLTQQRQSIRLFSRGATTSSADGAQFHVHMEPADRTHLPWRCAASAQEGVHSMHAGNLQRPVPPLHPSGHGYCHHVWMPADRQLDFSGQRPTLAGDFVLFTARSSSGPVRCRISTNTLEQMCRSNVGPTQPQHPLQAFENHRHKIETIFAKLHELGLHDEDGGITFSTSVLTNCTS